MLETVHCSLHLLYPSVEHKTKVTDMNKYPIRCSPNEVTVCMNCCNDFRVHHLIDNNISVMHVAPTFQRSIVESVHCKRAIIVN